MNEISRYMEKGKEVSQGAMTPVRSETLIRYRPFIELENWMKSRMEEKSRAKETFFWIIGGGFFLFGGPPFVLELIKALLQMTGGTGGGAAVEVSVAMVPVVIYFYLMVTTLVATAAAVYLAQPTHISITPAGLRFLSRHKFLNKELLSRDWQLIPWTLVGSIDIDKRHADASPSQQVITFRRSNSDAAFKARLGAIPTALERERLLQAIEQYAPDVSCSAEVLQALEPPPDHSYTELWMKALSAPPKRERLQPLMEGAFMRDGNYRIRGALGVGGQGTAYLAEDLTNGGTVVLKEFIFPVFVDINVRRQALEKFEHEARILKKLDHDQVVKLSDFFIEDHRGYLVLEHIDGMSLRQLVHERGALPESEVIGLAEQMCTILCYLHSLEPPVVHRDFTPDNLILRKDGTLKLVDFNVAQQRETTATGTVVGKHAYLPPEQFRGQPTTHSDIYAMGATLFYLLTGEDPEPISVSRPKKTRPEVSQVMDDYVAKATAIEAPFRYTDANEALIMVPSRSATEELKQTSAD